VRGPGGGPCPARISSASGAYSKRHTASPHHQKSRIQQIHLRGLHEGLREAGASSTLGRGKRKSVRAKTLGERRSSTTPGILLTHAVCVGMTGSGKDGGCALSLIGREAAIDGVPTICDRSKGRPVQPAAYVSTAPRTPADFPARGSTKTKARRARDGAGRVLPAQQAQTWKAGLADWGAKTGDRIARLPRGRGIRCLIRPGSNVGPSAVDPVVVRRARTGAATSRKTVEALADPRVGRPR